MENEHDIDQLFKRGLSDPEIPFNELDWERMAQKLDARKSRRIIPLWLYAAGGIAAMLIVFLFRIFSDTNPVKQDVLRTAGKTEISGKHLLPGSQDSVAEKGRIRLPDTYKTHTKADPITFQQFRDTMRHRAITTAQHQALTGFTETGLKNEFSLPVDTTLFDPSLYAVTLSDRVMDTTGIEHILPKKTTKSNSSKSSRLVLSILVAPDISNAGMHVSSKISSNFGVLASYPITNKLSLTSGLVYSKKYYNSTGIGTAGSGYLNKAWQINADCSVLDIPLNVNYKVLQKNKYGITVNTGLSSYFMLNEKYDFLIGEGSAQHVSQLELSNQNKHLLGVANFSVTVDRRLTRRLSLGIQPFIKVPLTGIGQYDSRLKSTGVSFSLNIGLFQPKK